MSKFLLFLLALPAVSATNLCEAPAEVREAFKRPAEKASLGRDRIEFTRSVLAKFPNDLWANRTYQDAFRQGLVYQQAVIDEYKAALAKHSGDPEYLYLYARVLIGTKTPAAIETLDQAIAKDSGYAPARLSLAEIYRAPNFKDAEKAKANLKVWMAACPSGFEGFHLLERMDDAEFVRTNAARLRTLLAARTDDLAIGNYRTLWMLEFQSNPAPEFARVRESIRADLAMLRALDESGGSTSPSTLRSALREGYKLAGDAEGTKWIEAKHPSSGASADPGESIKVSMDWQTAHPYPKPDAAGKIDPSAFEARNKAFLDVTGEWVAKWPNDSHAWSQRITALQMNRDTSDAEVESAAEGLKKASPGASTDFRIATVYVQRNMHLDDVPELVKKGLADIDKTPAPARASDLYPVPSQGAGNIQLMTRISGYFALSEAYLKLSRMQESSDALAELRQQLDEHKPDQQSNDFDKRMWGDNYSSYWNRMGQIAEKQGHKLDALTYYQNQIRRSSMPPDKNYIARQAKTLWTNLGGTPAAWDAWLANVETVKPVAITVATTHSEWTDKNTLLPAFQLADMNGNTWQLTKLQGKVTLVNLWATWCAPCKRELPLLQKLYEKVKDRSDVQVITFNTDDNPGLIEQFMKENKYTFPVLPARSYVDKIVPSLSIPRNWIVNKQAILKRESVGFITSSEGDWVEKMLNTMVKAN